MKFFQINRRTFVKMLGSEDHHLLSEEKIRFPEEIPGRKWRLSIVWMLVACNIGMFAFSIWALTTVVSPRSFQSSSVVNDAKLGQNECSKLTSAYSPIFDRVDISQSPYRINGLVTDNTSIFRGDPSPEVDAAWDEVSTEGFEIITVSADELAFAGHDLRLSVKAPLSWPSPDKTNEQHSTNHLASSSSPSHKRDRYVVQIDVFHQIHCLNQLRKQIDFDYYFGEQYKNEAPPPQFYTHLKHCVHILLQNLMCHADVEIIPHHWVHYANIHQEGRPYAEPLADFSIVKQCRNFDRVLDWAKDNAVTDLNRRWKDLREAEPPADAIVLDGAGGYF